MPRRLAKLSTGTFAVILAGMMLWGSAFNAQPAAADIARILQDAEKLGPLETVIVAVEGRIVAERGYRGHRTTAPANIKSASKSVVSTLVGIAIDKGLLRSVDQPIAEILARDFPADPDPRLKTVTIGHLLSMQAGLGRTSGANYGRWVASPNWVRSALAQPFADEPGGTMLYSTGSTHLLSAILARVGKASTLELARQWLDIEGFAIAAWTRDPQGVYLGGNEMAMTPRSLLAFGELYRNGGRAADGRQVVSEGWVRQSWTPRTQSRFTGDDYGYGWFLRDIDGAEVRYAWGYGGQMLYVAPSRRLTVVMTSDESLPSARTMHRDALHALFARIMAAL